MQFIYIMLEVITETLPAELGELKKIGVFRFSGLGGYPWFLTKQLEDFFAVVLRNSPAVAINPNSINAVPIAQFLDRKSVV